MCKKVVLSSSLARASCREWLIFLRRSTEIIGGAKLWSWLNFAHFRFGKRLGGNFSVTFHVIFSFIFPRSLWGVKLQGFSREIENPFAAESSSIPPIIDFEKQSRSLRAARGWVGFPGHSALGINCQPSSCVIRRNSSICAVWQPFTITTASDKPSDFVRKLTSCSKLTREAWYPSYFSQSVSSRMLFAPVTFDIRFPQ